MPSTPTFPEFQAAQNKPKIILELQEQLIHLFVLKEKAEALEGDYSTLITSLDARISNINERLDELNA